MTTHTPPPVNKPRPRGTFTPLPPYVATGYVRGTQFEVSIDTALDAGDVEPDAAYPSGSQLLFTPSIDTLIFPTHHSVAYLDACPAVVGPDGEPRTPDGDELKLVANLGQTDTDQVWYWILKPTINGKARTAYRFDVVAGADNYIADQIPIPAASPASDVVRGPAGPQGAPGPEGPGGNATVVDNQDGSFTTSGDGSSMTTWSIHGLHTVGLDVWTGVPETLDDTATITAAIADARANGYKLQATPYKTYRCKAIDPVAVTVDARKATFTLPNGGPAENVFAPSGPFRTIGGTWDGNKTGTADPGSVNDLKGNGVYVMVGAGWSDQIRMEGHPLFVNCWAYGARFLTVADLSGSVLADAASAPLSPVYLDAPEASANARSGIGCNGLKGLTIASPYVHHNTANGLTINLCNASRVTDFRGEYNTIHGYVSQYCADDYVDGWSCWNGKGGFTWGGGSTVCLPGRRHRYGALTADYNGQVSIPFAGVTFDPTIAGNPNMVVLDVKGGSISARYNTGAGVQVTMADTLDLGILTLDWNQTNGLALSGRNVSYTIARTRHNGTTAAHHGIVEYGGTLAYGGHLHGRYEISGNGDGLTVPYVTNPTLVTPSTYTVSQGGATTPRQPVYAYQGADQTVTNSATAVASALTVPVPANSTAEFDAFEIYDGPTTADYRTGWSGPAGSTLAWETVGPISTAGGTPATLTTSGIKTGTQNATAIGAVGVGVPMVARTRGTITTGATAGNLVHKFAQTTADPGVTKLYAASYVKITVVPTGTPGTTATTKGDGDGDGDDPPCGEKDPYEAGGAAA